MLPNVSKATEKGACNNADVAAPLSPKYVPVPPLPATVVMMSAVGLRVGEVVGLLVTVTLRTRPFV